MKVAVCIPCYGDTRALFTDALAQMLIHAGKYAEGVDLSVLMLISSDLAGNREKLAEVALEQGADWLLWLDSDQTFPPDTLARLLAADKALIGCNISLRSRPAAPTAKVFRGGAWTPVWTDETKAKAGEIERVDLMGLGVCLVHADVMRQLERPWFVFQKPGEDAHFFAKANRAGIGVYVDHALSWEVGHVGQHVYTNADAIADKAAWLSANQSMRG